MTGLRAVREPGRKEAGTRTAETLRDGGRRKEDRGGERRGKRRLGWDGREED